MRASGVPFSVLLKNGLGILVSTIPLHLYFKVFIMAGKVTSQGLGFRVWGFGFLKWFRFLKWFLCRVLQGVYIDPTEPPSSCLAGVSAVLIPKGASVLIRGNLPEAEQYMDSTLYYSYYRNFVLCTVEARKLEHQYPHGLKVKYRGSLH